MQSIETTQIDQYAQTMLKDRTLSVQERALSASLAIRSHVLTEMSLPVMAPMPMSEDDEECRVWHEDHLERVADSAMQDLMAKSYEAFEWIEDQQPEQQQKVEELLKLVEEVMGMDRHEITTHDGEVVRVFEGNTKFYNDDKDEQ